MSDGGCLCGALRYRLDAAPLDTGYCHCTRCRQSTGAPVLAWASIPVAAFAYTKGQPAIYHSSSWGRRPSTAPHWAPTRSSLVMPTVQLRRDAIDTI